jgi:hypothetical protein
MRFKVMRKNRSLAICLLGVGCAVTLAGCGRRSPGYTVEADAVGDVPANGHSAPADIGKASRGTNDYAFREDAGGKLLADLLTPSLKSPDESREPRAKPKIVADPPSLKGLESPLAPCVAGPLRVSARNVPATLTPRLLPEEPPFTGMWVNPVAPIRPVLPAEPRARVPSPNPQQTPPLPFLAQAQPDRAPLDDPTALPSALAALSAPLPVRKAPAPFARLKLPDPVEHANTVRLRTPPPEDSAPVTPPLRPPAR